VIFVLLLWGLQGCATMLQPVDATGTNKLVAPLSGEDARHSVLPLIDDVDARAQRWVDRIFLLGIITIVVFFSALLGYRYMGTRFVRKEKM
jgi:hypothetical protein